MTTRGKRLIFTDSMTILAQEAKAETATILPGMSVVQTATGVTPDNQADTIDAPLLVADYDFLKAQTVDDAWADGDNVVFRQLQSNMRANVRVSNGNNILRRGTPLARDGAANVGHLKIAAAGDVAVATADEIINVNATGFLVRVRGV